MSRRVSLYIHDVFYMVVDLEAVWMVVKDRIPALRPSVEQILQQLENEEQ